MIPKLRKKFISITAIALFIMILCVMVSINAIFIYQSNQMLDSRLSLIMGDMVPNGDYIPMGELNPSGDMNTPPQKDESLRPSDNLQNPQEKNQKNRTSTPALPEDFGSLFPNFEKNLRIQSDGCLICLNSDGSLKEIRQNSAEEYSEDELLSIATAIHREGKARGWHQYFRYRVITTTDAQGNTEITIGLINASSDLYSIFSMLFISSLIGGLSFLLVLLIIIFASNKAVKPIAESYARQKQFVTDAGHELKTPLTVISANNELARMIYGDSEWFDSIDNQISKMNGLVGNLITLAKMDEEQKPVFTSFNLSDAVYDTAKSFENLIHTKSKLITFDIADDIIFTGDESKLRQVVSILIDNAVKYCDEKGKIAVRLTSEKQIKLQVINDYAEVWTSDLSHVFERFYRADKARTSDGSYGLGLSIAKSIVELHKGEIQAKPLEHDRIMFEVTLTKSKL